MVVTIPTTLPFSSTGNPLNLYESINSTASFTVIPGVTTIGSRVIAALTLMISGFPTRRMMSRSVMIPMSRSPSTTGNLRKLPRSIKSRALPTVSCGATVVGSGDISLRISIVVRCHVTRKSPANDNLREHTPEKHSDEITVNTCFGDSDEE